MGQLVEGEWQDTWYDTEKTGGKFVRSTAKFRNWITADGSAGPEGDGGFAAEALRWPVPENGLEDGFYVPSWSMDASWFTTMDIDGGAAEFDASTRALLEAAGLVAVSQAQQTPPRVEQEKPIPQALRAMPCHQAIEFLLPDNSALLPKKMDHSSLPRG